MQKPEYQLNVWKMTVAHVIKQHLTEVETRHSVHLSDVETRHSVQLKELKAEHERHIQEMEACMVKREELSQRAMKQWLEAMLSAPGRVPAVENSVRGNIKMWHTSLTVIK